MTVPESHRTRTLWLTTVLHAFTHVYHVALIPLYLLIQQDLKLASVGAAPFLVTALGLAYFLPSYPLGVLADRFNRKKILAIGLAINGAGFVGLSLAPNYAWAIVAVIVAGFGGSFYHPAATALIARLFPIGTGRAFGLAGIGASVGFCVGPIYAGWRAESAGSWRTPVLELGVAGLIAAVLFAWLAEEHAGATATEPSRAAATPLFPSVTLWLFFLAAALAFSLRDFGAGGMGTLSSLFLQQTHGFSPKQAGLALAGIFAASVISNPLFGHLSDRGRLRWICFVLAIASVLIAVFPHLPRAALIPGLVVYGFFFLAGFPMVEAALMESVPDAARGRVFGLFITIAGLLGNLSHGAMGAWVKRLGTDPASVASYYSLFAVLALFVLASLVGLPCLHAIRKREGLEIVSSAVSSAPSPIANR
ncbi:MAG: MFS transporter [Verrucomicrobia bacterium]|nr:MFS transporter [Verrucomicrobiota bacterium]